MGFLAGGNEPPPHHLGGLGSAVSSSSGVRDGARKIRILEHFETSEITSVQLAFESGERQQVNQGEQVPPMPQRRSAPALATGEYFEHRM